MNVDQVLFVLKEIGRECWVSEMKIHEAQVHKTAVSEVDISLSSQRIHFMAGLLMELCFNNFRVPELSDLISKGFSEEDAKRVIAALEAEKKD